MGRELKRVPLDFEWPLNKVWIGFINPFHDKCEKCESCDGTGFSKEAKEKQDLWYGYKPFKPSDNGSVPFTVDNQAIINLATRNIEQASHYYGKGQSAIDNEIKRLCDLFNSKWSNHLNENDIKALVDGGRLLDFTHTWTKENKWVKKIPEYIPTPEEVNNWSISSLGHDCINLFVCTEAALKRENIKFECSACNGEGTFWPNDEIKSSYDNWKDYQPPEGDGYQIWETTSEGSPVSPVFSKPEDLAHYMVVNGSGAFSNCNFEFWMNFILGDGWTPTIVLNIDK